MADIDLDMTRRYLRLLDANPLARFTFQTFDDKSNRGGLAKVLHGTFNECALALSRANGDGAGVFAMVNAGDGITHPGDKTCRTNRNVIRVRALFVDLDGAPIEPVLEAADPPHILIESSQDRWHAYWLVRNLPLEEFSARQRQLAGRFGGDKAVVDLARVMRLPGFYHHKREPFMSRLVLDMKEIKR